MAQLDKCFFLVRKFIAKKFPACRTTKLFIGCPSLMRDKAYSQEKRLYMHVGHKRNTICVMAEAGLLPRRNLLGLFLHEFGHIIGGPSQYEADMAILTHFGIPIFYDKKEIQYIV